MHTYNPLIFPIWKNGTSKRSWTDDKTVTVEHRRKGSLADMGVQGHARLFMSQPVPWTETSNWWVADGRECRIHVINMLHQAPDNNQTAAFCTTWSFHIDWRVDPFRVYYNSPISMLYDWFTRSKKLRTEANLSVQNTCYSIPLLVFIQLKVF